MEVGHTQRGEWSEGFECLFLSAYCLLPGVFLFAFSRKRTIADRADERRIDYT